jgi:hypothetical protein
MSMGMVLRNNFLSLLEILDVLCTLLPEWILKNGSGSQRVCRKTGERQTLR